MNGSATLMITSPTVSISMSADTNLIDDTHRIQILFEYGTDPSIPLEIDIHRVPGEALGV